MRNMTLENIAACLQSELKQATGQESFEIKGAVLDSRKIEEGFAFFATKGARVDGHDFIPNVAEKGAALVICEEVPTVDIPYILVEDSFDALKKVAAYYRQQLNIPIVGITGSVGKTSTKEMVAATLSTKFCVQKTQGNFNNEVGLPLTILTIRDEHQVAVVEMGINHFEEMHRLSQIARPNICVITNIGPCHLENLGDLDGVLQAKTEIFDYMQEDGFVVLNGDDIKLSTIQKVGSKTPYFFGVNSKHNQITASSIRSNGLFGSDFTLHLNGTELQATVPLPGAHMVTNALAAACVGDILGMSHDEILAGIASVRATSGRSNIMRFNNKTVIDDCYNANPVSMKSAIDLLKMANTKQCVILGDMFELGEQEDALHNEVGRYAALAQVDQLIFIGNLAENMYQGAMKAGAKAEYYPSKHAFLEAHSPVDFMDFTVLVKASHGMHFEEIVDWLKN